MATVAHKPEMDRAGDAPRAGSAGASAHGSPLTAQHKTELAKAKARAKKIRKAIGVARFSAWSTAFFAAVSVPFAFFSTVALMMCIALSAIAFNEFGGLRMLRNFDPRGPRRLGWNQIIFGAVICVYAAYSIFATMNSTSEMSQMAGSMLGSAAGSGDVVDVKLIEDIATLVAITIYGLLIPASVAFQGGLAWYYFTRKKYVMKYRKETPEWVMEMQREDG